MCIFCFIFFVSTLILLYLGDVAGTGETERHRADRLGHEPHGDLIPTIPHRLDGLADVPVVMSHADVLRTAETPEMTQQSIENLEEKVSFIFQNFLLP